MSLADLLARTGGSSVGLVTTGGEIRREELLERAARWVRPGLEAHVAVAVRDPLLFLEVLVGLDGVAASMAVLSPGLEPAVIERLARDAGCHGLITDDASVEEAVDLPVLSGEPWGHEEKPRKQAQPTRWALATSGTTGTPKLVGHTLASLTRTTKVHVTSGADLSWGLLYDMTRFAGMQVALQALLGGSKLLLPGSADPLAVQLAFLDAHGVTHLSATPSLWRKVLMTPGIGLQRLRQVTLGGEIADQYVLDALRARFPEARITHIFASTEAGVGFSVSDGRAGFPEDYLRDHPGGIEMDIRDGRLHLRSAEAASRYLGDRGELADGEGWVDTGDLVRVEGSRVLFLGRASGIINVGGSKVVPEHVEQCLLAHPAVAQARVSMKKNSITGGLVAAEIVLQPGAGAPGAARREVMRHARERLERHEAPALVSIVSSIGLSSSGKVKRIEP